MKVEKLTWTARGKHQFDATFEHMYLVITRAPAGWVLDMQQYMPLPEGTVESKQFGTFATPEDAMEHAELVRNS